MSDGKVVVSVHAITMTGARAVVEQIVRKPDNARRRGPRYFGIVMWNVHTTTDVTG